MNIGFRQGPRCRKKSPGQNGEEQLYPFNIPWWHNVLPERKWKSATEQPDGDEAGTPER
jgi:hypothetical protein